MDRKLSDILERTHVKRQAGYNCAEGVFWGVAQYFDLKVPVSCMTGFGGGIAGSGSVCGALCGALALAGVYVGREAAADSEAKTKAGELSRAIARGFEKEMGTQLCREILGYMPGAGPKTEGINPQCQKAVFAAIQLAVQEIRAAGAN